MRKSVANKTQIILFLITCFVILVTISSCEDKKDTPAPQKPATKPTQDTRASDGDMAICMVAKDLGTKYSKNFEELICALKNSRHNEKLKTIVLAQWILESGRGSSKLAKKFNNYGGLKWRPEMLGYGVPTSYNAHDGRTNYVSFESPKAYIEGYWAFIARHPYTGWEKYKNDPIGYINFIVKAGYCPDNGYVKNVLSLQKEAANLLRRI